MNRKGHVLVHVLITTIIVVIIAAGLAQTLLMRYTAGARANDDAVQKAAAQAGLNQAITTWNSGGNSICAALPGPWISKSGGAGACNCSYEDDTTYTSVGYHVRVWAHTTGGTCQFISCTASVGGSFQSSTQCP